MSRDFRIFENIERIKLHMVVHACNLSTLEGQAGNRSLKLCSKFEASLNYRRPCLKEERPAKINKIKISQYKNLVSKIQISTNEAIKTIIPGCTSLGDFPDSHFVPEGEHAAPVLWAGAVEAPILWDSL